MTGRTSSPLFVATVGFPLFVMVAFLSWLFISNDIIHLNHWKKNKGIPLACPNTSIWNNEHFGWCLEDVDSYNESIQNAKETISKFPAQRRELKNYQDSICGDGLSSDSKAYVYCVNSRNYESSCKMAYPDNLDKFKTCLRGFADRSTISFGDEISAGEALKTTLLAYIARRKEERIKAGK